MSSNRHFDELNWIRMRTHAPTASTITELMRTSVVHVYVGSGNETATKFRTFDALTFHLPSARWCLLHDDLNSNVVCIHRAYVRKYVFHVLSAPQNTLRKRIRRFRSYKEERAKCRHVLVFVFLVPKFMYFLQKVLLSNSWNVSDVFSLKFDRHEMKLMKWI